MTAPEGVYVAAATASVRTEGVNDGYIASTAGDEPFRAAVDATYAATLTAAYWKLHDHAEGYRNTKVFRHEWYARGIEAAARDIAELLGVPEHEIEREEPA